MTLVKLKGWNKGSYQLSAKDMNAERCVNLYPSISEQETGKEQEQAFLQSCPGLTSQYFFSSYGNIRGIYTDKSGLLWVVAGSSVLTITQTGGITNKGTLNSFEGRVEFESDFTKVVIVDGACGYIFPSSLSGTIQALYDDNYISPSYTGAISPNHGLITGDIINITGYAPMDGQGFTVIYIDDNRFAFSEPYIAPPNRLSGTVAPYGSVGDQLEITLDSDQNFTLQDGQSYIIMAQNGDYAYKYQIHQVRPGDNIHWWFNFPVYGIATDSPITPFTDCYIDPIQTATFDTAQAAMRLLNTPGWLGSSTVTFQDGFFIFVSTGDYKTTTTQPPTLFFTNFSTIGQKPYYIDPLNYIVIDNSGDPIVKALSDHGVLWVFQTRHTSVFYDAGTTSAQFLPIQGANQETGCVAAATIQKVGGILMWLSQDDRGGCVVMKTEGWYHGSRCSTQALEQSLTGNPNLAQASAYTYQQGGHSFYCLNVPGLLTTWCFDLSTHQWHERGEWQNGAYYPFRVQTMAYTYGTNWAAGPSSSDLYIVDPTTFAINDLPLRWLRVCPHTSSSLNRVFYNSIQVDMQVGAGMWPLSPTWYGPGDGSSGGGGGLG